MTAKHPRYAEPLRIGRPWTARQFGFDEVYEAAMNLLGIKPSDLWSDRRSPDIIHAKQHVLSAVYLLTYREYSFPELAHQILRRRNHSGALHSIHGWLEWTKPIEREAWLIRVQSEVLRVRRQNAHLEMEQRFDVINRRVQGMLASHAPMPKMRASAL